MRVVGPILLSLALLALALPVTAQVDLGGGIVNVTPAITSVTVAASFDPTAGTTTSIPVTTVITDTNGCSDLSSGGTVTAAIYTSGDVLTVAATTLSFSSCSLGVAATYSGNVPMQFYTAAGTYKVRISATDQALANVLANLATAPTFAYTSLVAMSSDSSFSFGTTLNPGDSSATGSGVAVTNAGNAQIDTQVSGTALTLASPAASIAVSNVKYSLSSDLSGSTSLSGSAAAITAFNLAAGASSAKTIYLQLTVPSAASQYLPAGTYTGTMTITAVSG